uniref:Uncharacterized protein n=1 Tax=Anguilla anguilla TaxID=7936 RepID=A0A0E9WN54_ANGAN
MNNILCSRHSVCSFSIYFLFFSNFFHHKLDYAVLLYNVHKVTALADSLDCGRLLPYMIIWLEAVWYIGLM